MNCRMRIPEEFLWQAFHDFAGAYYHMATFRLESLSIRDPRARDATDHYILHLDLKHDNGTP